MPLLDFEPAPDLVPSALPPEGMEPKLPMPLMPPGLADIMLLLDMPPLMPLDG
jgi:hypothetical protein